MNVTAGVVRRLEASAAAATVEIAAGLARVDPPQRPRTVSMGGGALVAFGPGRYVNRGVGVSLSELTDDDADVIERFFVDRGLPPALELSAWAPAATTSLLRRRRYAVSSFRSMFAATPAMVAAAPVDGVSVVAVADRDVDRWVAVFTAGFEVDEPVARAVSDEFARAVNETPGSSQFLAIVDGQPAGCGSLHVVGAVGWLGAAATMPAFRNRGVQRALVHYRTFVAQERACDLVTATAVPTGASARNLRRLGFDHVQDQVIVERHER